jgi:protein gp37
VSETTTISWTKSTWVPVTGCTRVSPGCDHCYAFQLHDQRHVAWLRGRWEGAPPQYYEPFSTVQLMPARLLDPLTWMVPRHVFVTSMGDLFHEAVPDDYLDQIFAVMALASRHRFQVLTKRPARMKAYLDRGPEPIRDAMHARGRELEYTWSSAKLIRCYGRPEDDWQQLYRQWPFRNIWTGITVENQAAADERIPILLDTPSALRWLSVEPLLEAVDISLWTTDNTLIERPGIKWVVVGGESGPHRRPFDEEWAGAIAEQCLWAGVPVFAKQTGALKSEQPFVTIPDLNSVKELPPWD